MPTVELTVRAILFDSDGTLIDSTPAFRVDPREFAAAQHGTRAKDLLRRFARVPKLGSEMSEEELDEAVEELEREVGRTAKRMADEGKGGIVMLPGVEELLKGLGEGGARWGIVTSELRKLDPTLEAKDVLVIEDAPSGLQSGHAAGCRILAVSTGPVSADEVAKAAAEIEGALVVRDLTSIELVSCDGQRIKLRVQTLGNEQ
ncbi:DL-glycerol-3-phosphatase [Rhodotorula kratochvilovae]